ncbi:methylated-DNA--[protein]-cysteine S-methyltransferase [Roseibaca sp. Y0-43]|uniref:methylated-DNA--[protein]-cysteine S-methyltransferase n=1 Tax=Roseibaca sp. Y0-43 TaxID=2816854 RepID=UPI001D0CA07F|nr:bifunctional helix-turn-helix domain-containing protein/methylated-DNA--[protein]-cysteine S-methyltransferase [Roseibaca sp. Y0-43]MCC1482607.1 bifunctional helix-turn-helix domain-containing protein/methylated-DNA--[protein]-cysteine S-methyltransferase [Roseibaca sp. Y0-43]
MDQSYHYKLIARAIALIDAPGGTSRSLDDLAAELGLSAAHFQRVFSAWAGVSPKRYQQYLTLGHARRLLEARFSTFDTALELGLSGQARLHDLFLRWEAMTPGDYAKRGDGLTIRHAWLDSPFGPALAMATERGLCGLAFAEMIDDPGTLADMTRRWPKARYIADAGAVAEQMGDLFQTRGTARLHMMGTPFQIKVWEALLHVPPGHVTSYGEVAKRVCSERAARAVGTAVGRNPLGFVIPCHRVLQGSGALGGYHWGLTRKRAMLGWEAARTEAEAAPLSQA